MTKKILNYSEYSDTNQTINELLFLMDENNDLLTEVNIQDVLAKFGFKVHKSKGIITHLKNASVGLAKLIIAAIRGDGSTIKEISQSVKREDVLDFLMKLDLATLHLITGPIHFINAVTGWDLEIDIQHESPNITNSIKSIIDKLKTSIQSLSNNKRKKISLIFNKITNGSNLMLTFKDALSEGY